MKEKTDEEFEEELKQKMHDIAWENVHIYRDLSMGKWWYFFAAAFCLIWAISYMPTYDVFSIIFLSFISGTNFTLYLVKCDE